MEAPKTQYVLASSISKAINEMHAAGPSYTPTQRLKEIDPELYDALQQVLSAARAARSVP
jgi:hypothetical protein